ncbi:MAG: Nif3-like dinuclear metal center hexameric protein [Lactovum sp.]
MKIIEFIEKYEKFCPKELAEEGDPVGLQIGSSDKEVKKILVTLDIREQTVAEAIEKGVDLIIAKHPIIFHSLSKLTDQDSQEKLVLDLVKADISVYISHTNIDILEKGLNHYFAELLEMTEIESLMPSGLGKVGKVEEQSLTQFIKKVKSVFHLEHLRLVTYNHDLTRKIDKVAICGGSAGKFWPEALKKEADIYITADIYYHVGLDICSTDLIVLDIGHYMEHLFIPFVTEKIRIFRKDIEILESSENTNPFYDI